MSQISSAPWSVECGPHYRAIRAADIEVIANMREIGGVFNDANTRLIVSSPKMLAALKVAVSALNAIPNKRIANCGYKDSYGVASMLDSVIREAEGD